MVLNQKTMKIKDSIREKNIEKNNNKKHTLFLVKIKAENHGVSSYQVILNADEITYSWP